MNNTTEFTCTAYEENYKPRRVSAAHFFVIYTLLAVVSCLGNGAIVWILARRQVSISRRTFRFLTLLLSCYELLAAASLLLVLFRIAVGYSNRVTGGSSVSPNWLDEDENPYVTRRYSVSKLLISMRDVSVGSEVNAYCLLALDRLLAIAAPVSSRWNQRMVMVLAGVGLAITVGGEAALQMTLMLSLSAKDSKQVCSILTSFTRTNALIKACLGIMYYILSLACYTATGALLLKRVKSRATRTGSTTSLASSAEQMKKPLAALIVGNLVQFISLLPMLIDNFGLVRLDIAIYYCFFLHGAAVPFITFCFNANMRQAVFSPCYKWAKEQKREGRRRANTQF